MAKPVCRSIKEHAIQAASEAAAREIGIASLKTKQTEAISYFFYNWTRYICFFIN